MDKYDIVRESDKLLFVKVTPLLIEDYLKMINDEEILRLISRKRRIVTYEMEEQWIKNKLINNEEIFTILTKDTLEFVGNIELMDIADGSCEMGICLTMGMQDKHYGTEAIKEIIKYAKDVLGLSEMRLAVFNFNDRAIHCYQKLGFVEYQKNDEEIFMKRGL